MSMKTEYIDLNKNCLETIELKVLQNWAVANISEEYPTAEELNLFNEYRNSMEGQQAYEAVFASAPSH